MMTAGTANGYYSPCRPSPSSGTSSKQLRLHLTSPIYSFINGAALFRRSAAQIDARRLNTLMTHQIGEKGYVRVLGYEVLSKQVPKRMGVYNIGVYVVTLGSTFETERYTTAC